MHKKRKLWVKRPKKLSSEARYNFLQKHKLLKPCLFWKEFQPYLVRPCNTSKGRKKHPGPCMKDIWPSLYSEVQVVKHPAKLLCTVWAKKVRLKPFFVDCQKHPKVKPLQSKTKRPMMVLKPQKQEMTECMVQMHKQR